MLLIGESAVGEGKEVAHIELLIGEKGGAVEQAFVNAFTTPRAGHVSVLAVLEPNLPTKPSTLMVNKVTVKSASQENLIFGPAQAAVARAVMDSVEAGVIRKDRADDLLLIVSVYVDKSAEDKAKIYEYNYEATRQAIERAIENEPDVDYVLKRKETAKHPLR